MDSFENTMASSNSSRAIAEIEMGPIKRSKGEQDKEPERIIQLGLERNFTPLMALCFSFSAVGVLTALSQVVAFGLTTGGPVVMVWGWLCASFFNYCVAYSMGMICSVHPGAGSVYYWTAMLCPWPKWAPVLSLTAGYLNLMGCVMLDATLAQAVV